MSAFDAWDLAVLTLALDLLRHHSDVELANARAQRNARKQLAMLVMREQIAVTRAKVAAMVSP